MEEVLDRLTAPPLRGAACARTAGGARSASRYASTTSPRTRGPARSRAPVNAAVEVGAVARELLREFAPPRPVRLLGVRVASFDVAADDAAPQLALPV